MTINIEIEGTAKEITDLVIGVQGRLCESIVDERIDTSITKLNNELLSKRTPYSDTHS